MKALSLLAIVSGLIARAGDQSVIVDGQTISGITAVVRLSESNVGIRYSGGLEQERIDKLPDAFLQSWNIQNNRIKVEPNPPESTQELQTFNLVKTQWYSGLYGGVLEYTLNLLIHPKPYENTLEFSFASTEEHLPKESPALMGTLMISEKYVGDIINIIEKYKIYLNTKAAEPQLVGTTGRQQFYYAPQGVMTESLSTAPSEDSGGVMMRFVKSSLTDPAYFNSDELDVLESLLRRFQKGEFESLIDRTPPSAKEIPLVGSESRTKDVIQSPMRPNAEPVWSPEVAIELSQLVQRFDVVVMPVSKQPGFYLHHVWIPLGESSDVIRKEIPELKLGHHGTENADLRIPGASMTLILGYGLRIRKLVVSGIGLGENVPLETTIFGGLYFGDDVEKVIKVLGPPTQAKLPYSVTYQRPDYHLEIGFNYGKLFVITLNSHGYDGLN